MQIQKKTETEKAAETTPKALAAPGLDGIVDVIEAAAKDRDFSKLSREEKRVAIAKDVLKQIDEKVFLPYAGVYVRELEGTPCMACAVGSACLAAFRLDGNASWRVGQGPGQAHAYAALAPYFEPDQLARMEAAFERTDTYRKHFITSGQAMEAVAFGHKFEGPTARLRGIMQNIIDNGGTFKP